VKPSPSVHKHPKHAVASAKMLAHALRVSARTRLVAKLLQNHAARELVVHKCSVMTIVDVALDLRMEINRVVKARVVEK